MSLRTSEYKHIVLDGQDRPVIQGTRLKVRDLVRAHLAHGWSADELAWQFQGVTLAQVHGALSYYFDHQVEIDADILSAREFEREMEAEQQDDPVAQKLRKQIASRRV
ncbi:MAG: hypothetical protein AMXMBFR33_73570 [Candidatus Xenobia bacterium]